MNDMTVGMENLPNVFIKKISILPLDSSGYEITVVLEMFDRADSPSWYSKEGMEDLKIKITYESILGNISSLNNGTKSLFSYSPASSTFIGPPPTDESIVVSSSEFTFKKQDGDYSSYQKSIRFVTPLYENLSIYAACFIGNLDFSNPTFKKYYGPMAGENVFVGGELNNLSYYFYYPDTNQEYGGPVHEKPDGSFMEGSKHKDTPHKEVVLVTEENFKIRYLNFDASSVGINLVDTRSSIPNIFGTIDESLGDSVSSSISNSNNSSLNYTDASSNIE